MGKMLKGLLTQGIKKVFDERGQSFLQVLASSDERIINRTIDIAK
jgi:hypothetical protein